MDSATTCSFKKTYVLKAQSPLIHFQSEQWGAALRASEVKPKFDRFLANLLAGTKELAAWTRGPQKRPSFLYKMHIKAVGGRKVDFPPKLFYAELDVDVQDKTRMILCDCQLEVVCFIPELLDIIHQHIAEFFLVTNFGRMQSKGFGSFVVENSVPNRNEISRILKKHAGAKTCYAFSGYNVWAEKQVFGDIGKIYGVMKSGVNRGGYRHSYLFDYCHEKMGIGNEKAAMKKEKISPWDENGPVRNPGKPNYYAGNTDEAYHYVRGLLGVGEVISYVSGHSWHVNRKGIEGWWPAGDLVNVKITNETVERLSSPIFFKIIGDTVYMVAKRIPNVIFGQPFTFKNMNTKQELVLTVPEQFDIDDFLDYFVTRYNRDTAQLRTPDTQVPYDIGQEIIEIGE